MRGDVCLGGGVDGIHGQVGEAELGEGGHIHTSTPSVLLSHLPHSTGIIFLLQKHTVLSVLYIEAPFLHFWAFTTFVATTSTSNP